MDEWGQADLLTLLTRYARTMLPRPMVIEKPGGESDEEVDSDLTLLLSLSEPLFQSNNPAVCTSAHTHIFTHNLFPGRSRRCKGFLLSRTSL